MQFFASDTTTTHNNNHNNTTGDDVGAVLRTLVRLFSPIPMPLLDLMYTSLFGSGLSPHTQQEQQRSFEADLMTTVAFWHNNVEPFFTKAMAAVEDAQRRAAPVAGAIFGICGVGVVTLLVVWVSRGVVNGMSNPSRTWMQQQPLPPPPTTETVTSDDNELTTCVTCAAHRRNVVFVPCAHLIMCRQCVESQKNVVGSTLKCPLCRQEVLGEVDVRL